MLTFVPFITGSRHAKMRLQAYSDSEGPHQPAYPCSLIRVFSPLLNRIIGYYRLYKLRAKALMILCACGGRSESAHFVQV